MQCDFRLLGYSFLTDLGLQQGRAKLNPYTGVKMTKKFNAVTLLLLLSLFVAAPVKAVGLSCLTLPELMKAYLITHVTTHNLTAEVKDKVIDQYVKILDSFKMLLL